MKQSNQGKHVLDAQCRRWKEIYSEDSDFFGQGPSYPAKKALEIFKQKGKTKILELGGGQGRDTLYFAKNGFQIWTLDYCENGINSIKQKAEKLGLSDSVVAICHDIRKPLPFRDEYFDCCFSHMLFCMALTISELEFLSEEIRRVLKPDGINIYTVRNTNDKHYKTGTFRGEDLYEINGFIVHFFSKSKIEDLGKGYEIVDIEEFEEGELPRRLYFVELKKNNGAY